MKIKNKIKIRIYAKWIILLTLVLVMVPVVVDAAAAVPTAAGTLGETFTKMTAALTGVFVYLIKVLQKILWPIFLAIGGLLNNDLIFGSGMEERLLDIWTNIRDFVNIGFVVILLGVAIYNVTGFASDNYQLKSMLPKIAIGLIAVNFSYIALKVMLDVTNVIAIAIFTLPETMNVDKSSNIVSPISPTSKALDPETHYEVADSSGVKYRVDTNLSQKFCKSMFGKTAEYDQTFKNATASDLRGVQCKVDNDKYKFTEAGVDFFKRFTSRNASLILAMQMMNIVNIDEVSAAVQGTKVDWSKVTFNLLFSFILYIVYGSAYVALFAVLLVRLVVLWIVIAVSPAIALAFVMPKLLEGSSDLKDKFIQNAIAPIKIAIPITLGYLMLDAFKKYSKSGNVGDANLASSLQNMNVEISGISDLQSMIIAFAAVAVVWIGVFSAAEKTSASGITNWIKGKVGGVGKNIAGSIQYLPIIPSKVGGGRSSISTLGKLMNKPFTDLRDRADTRFRNMFGGGKGTNKDKLITAAKGKDAKAIHSELTAAQHRIKTKEMGGAVFTAMGHMRANHGELKVRLEKAFEKIVGGKWQKKLKGGEISTATYRRVLDKAGINPTQISRAAQNAPDATRAGGKAANLGNIAGTSKRDVELLPDDQQTAMKNATAQHKVMTSGGRTKAQEDAAKAKGLKIMATGAGPAARVNSKAIRSSGAEITVLRSQSDPKSPAYSQAVVKADKALKANGITNPATRNKIIAKALNQSSKVNGVDADAVGKVLTAASKPKPPPASGTSTTTT